MVLIVAFFVVIYIFLSMLTNPQHERTHTQVTRRKKMFLFAFLTSSIHIEIVSCLVVFLVFYSLWLWLLCVTRYFTIHKNIISIEESVVRWACERTVCNCMSEYDVMCCVYILFFFFFFFFVFIHFCLKLNDSTRKLIFSPFGHLAGVQPNCHHKKIKSIDVHSEWIAR